MNKINYIEEVQARCNLNIRQLDEMVFCCRADAEAYLKSKGYRQRNGSWGNWKNFRSGPTPEFISFFRVFFYRRRFTIKDAMTPGRIVVQGWMLQRLS